MRWYRAIVKVVVRKVYMAESQKEKINKINFRKSTRKYDHIISKSSYVRFWPTRYKKMKEVKPDNYSGKTKPTVIRVGDPTGNRSS